jgi:hypothetical protein
MKDESMKKKKELAGFNTQAEKIKAALQSDLDRAYARAPKVDYTAIVQRAAAEGSTLKDPSSDMRKGKKGAKQIWFRVLPLSTAAAVFAILGAFWIPQLQKDQAIAKYNNEFVEELFSDEALETPYQLDSAWFDLEDSLY